MTHNMTTRYGHKREMEGSKKALSILNEYGKSKPRVWLEYGWSMARVWLEYAKVPVSRYAVMLVLMIVGVNGVKAQTVDYSGTYYIGSYGKDDKDNIGYTEGSTETNYYLCPTEGWIYYEYKNNKDDYTLTPNGQPFITSYQCKSSSKDYDATKAEWVITKHSTSEYYYIQQRKTGKYLVFNEKINTASSANRIRVHLEGGVESYEPNDYALFEITTNPANSYLNGAYLFHPKKASAGYYLNISEGNQDALIGTNAKTDGPTYSNFTKYVGGTLGQWNEANNTSSYRFEDIIPAPIITQTDDNIITITYSGSETVILYYTTNGDKPDPANAGGSKPTQIYEVGTTTITMSNPVTTVRAIAVKTAGTGESLDTYSRCVTLTTQRYIGSVYSYMFQNVECTDFYMMPGDVKSSNTEVNTSSLFRSTMEWKFTNAGSVDGVQYYYIINGHTGDYLYHTIVNIGKECAVYMKTSSEFGDATDKTGYMFTLVQGYSDDEKNNPDGFHIVPKSQISASNYCIYKGGWGTTPPTLANSKADAMKGSGNARRPEQYHTRWNIITYAAPGNVLPTSLVTSDESNPSLFKFENVGTPGQYMNNASTVGTATLGNDALAWYIKEAASDSERKYYYIVNKNGKYLKFNQTISSPVTNMGDKADVLSLLDYDNSESDRYQFVFAKSTVDGAYYIVPKGLEEASKSNYYALYLNGSQIKSTKNRQSDSYKWKFIPFCENPVFEESEGNITLSCATTGAEIHYTNDGTEPDGSSTTYSSGWASSTQLGIKAIAVIKDGSDNVVSTSEIVTLLNKPDITLAEVTYTYKGMAWEPEVTVSITSGTTTTAPTSPATYTKVYTDNINVGTASVSIADADEDDNWYIWNAPNANFTIEHKAVTITANSVTKGYDHTPLTESGFTTSPLEEGDTHTFTVVMTEGSTITNLGTISNVIATVDGTSVTTGTETVVGNYKVTTVNGTLEITKRSLGDGNLAPGFTIEFGDGGVFILKDGEFPLEESKDYTIGYETTSVSGRYSEKTISGKGNYIGEFAIRNAIVNFQTDADEVEWSATFVAENAAGIASNNSANGHKLPDGITAYIITAIEGNWAIPKPLEYIPEGIPVLLVSDKETGGFLVEVASGHEIITTEDQDANMLVENTASTHFDARTIYLLSYNEFVHNMDGYLAAGKVYLNPNHSSYSPSPAPVRLRIMWEDVTGIEELQNDGSTETRNDSWYTLDGRKLSSKPTRKGMYIVNREKVIIR